MYKTVHFDGKNLLVDMGEYLKKHDLVYKTPAYEGYEGLPAGNGDIGCMVWNTRREAVIALNKCDALDCRDEGNFGAWAWEEEERNTALVSCASIRITDGQPSFDRLYLEDFEGRLELSSGRIKTRSATPFSKWSYEIYVSHAYKCMVADINALSAEPVERTISLERWGSRNFFHYYENFVGDPSLKLEGTQTGERDGCIYIYQKLRGTSFIVCAKLIGDEHVIKLENSHETCFALRRNTHTTIQLVVTVVCGKENDELLDAAVKNVNACASDLKKVSEEHRAFWNSFWKKSFINIKDDYIENIYYLYLYQMNSSSRGKLPDLFNGSLWIWNHDIRNWGHLYHWNQQQQYWGMHAANHPELVRNYLDFRFGMLENAKKDAIDIWGVEGAFFSDICSLTGFQAHEPDTVRNFTVGPQLAMDFYKHYLYTGDVDFLREKAYPFMKECIRFYMNLLKEENGRYHINGGTVYESYWNMKDTLTDHVAIKLLFKAACEAAEVLNEDTDETEAWKSIHDGIYDIPLTILETEEGSKRVFSCGVKWDGNNIGFEEGEYPFSPFTGSVLCPVYPAGLTGLAQKGTELFETAVQTARIFFDTKVYAGGNDWCGHTPLPEIAARLGMDEDLKKLLHIYIDSFQCFPNGFMHYANIRNTYGNKEAKHLAMKLNGDESVTYWNKLHEKSYGDRVSYPMSDFYHQYNETGGNITAAVNEMLLQSYDGVIRVFPALPYDEDAIFTLCAAGNFLVTSEKIDGDVLFVSVRSNNGGKCRICKPWDCKTDVIINNEITDKYEDKSGIIVIDTNAGDVVTLQRTEFPLNIYYNTRVNSYINNGVKRMGHSILGKEREY